MVIQTSRKRLVWGVLVALALAFVLAAVQSADAQVAVNPCRGLTSADPLWWFMGCYLY